MFKPSTKHEDEVLTAEYLAAARRAKECSIGVVYHQAAKSRFGRETTQQEVERDRLYNNQTSMLQWLRRHGHQVDFSNDGRIPKSSPPGTPPLLPMAKYHGTPCLYCGVGMLIGTARPPTRDHKIPKYRRKQFVALAPQSNIAIVCSPCNNNKGSKTLLEFAAWLARRRDPRAAIVARYIEQIGWKEIERKVGWPSG